MIAATRTRTPCAARLPELPVCINCLLLSVPTHPRPKLQMKARPSRSKLPTGAEDVQSMISTSRPTPSTSWQTHRWAASPASNGRSSIKRMFPCPFASLHICTGLHPLIPLSKLYNQRYLSRWSLLHFVPPWYFPCPSILYPFLDVPVVLIGFSPA